QQGGVGGFAWDAPLAETAAPENAAPAAGEPVSEPEGVLSALPSELQSLAYSRPRLLLHSSYKVLPDDTVSELAETFGLNQDTILSINNISQPRLLQIGQELRIPNQDGILHQVQTGETLEKIAEQYKTDDEAIRVANELFSSRVNTGSSLFIPGARYAPSKLHEIVGTLFNWPIRGGITSSYGYRTDPFGGPRQFHSGIDIGGAMGAPVRAALSGQVAFVGYNEVMGNYIVISHHSGYRTLYGHLNQTHVKSGDYVRTGDRIGEVGSTGLSTGPHLHFTVYQNGRTTNPRFLLAR
ncbi:MAG: M23 family metallopeptidase, partial [Spirochaetaceae bacterium]|nr:M23 family metallopeptidase [Spirochaetaceae bacterium]